MAESRSAHHFETETIPALLAEAEARGLEEHARLGPVIEAAFGHLLGPLDPSRGQDLARRCLQHAVKNDLVVILRTFRRMPEVLSLLRCHGAERLLELQRSGRPALLLFAHVGPRSGAAAALASLGIRATALRQGKGNVATDLEGIDAWKAAPGSLESQLFLKHATASLRRGGCVLLGIDGHLGKGHFIHPCLGRKMPFAKGIFALQEMTGAPVIPVYARWADDRRIDCFFDDPLCEGEAGQPLELQRVADWVEARLRFDPSQIRINKLQEYVSLPLA